MGLIGYLETVQDKKYTIKNTPIIFIIPKEYLSDNLNDTFQAKQKIKIEVLEARIKYKSSQIQVVGKLV